MSDNTGSFTFKSGWRPSGPGQERYALTLDVLIFLPGLILAIVALWVQHRANVVAGNGLFSGHMLMLLTIPTVAGLISAICRLRITPFIAFILVALYWCLLVLFGGISLQGFALFFWALVPLAVLFATSISTTVLTSIRIGGIWAFLALATGVLAGSTVFSIEMNHREKAKHPVLASDPYPIGPDVMAIDNCAHLFRLSHPEGGYPEFLRQMGPEGSGCLPQTLMEGKHKGFSIDYQPGTKDPSGRVESYTVRAEQASPHGPDFSVVSSDESGLILITFPGTHGKGGVFPYSSLGASFEYLVRCLNEGIAEHKTSADDVDQAVQLCWGQSRLGEGYLKSRGHLKSPCFEITYKFLTNPTGVINGFVATGRPVIYGGSCGIRSYLIEAKDSKLRMYATAENRPAERSDPMAKMCELKERGYCLSPAEIN